MKNGQIVAQGRPSEIVHEKLFENVFQVSATTIVNPINGSPLVIFLH